MIHIHVNKYRRDRPVRVLLREGLSRLFVKDGN